MPDILRRLMPSRPRLRTTADLAEFVAAQGAFVAQKSTIEYCRAKAGLNWNKLFKEAPFLQSLDVCRWEAYPAVLSDMIVIVEGLLRPEVLGREAAAIEALGSLLEGILRNGPQPGHAAGNWDEVVADCLRRLARARLAAPEPPERIARIGANRIFDALPIHPSIRRNDREMVVNSVRFQMVAFSDRLLRQADAPSLARALLRHPAG